jgi:hypothetical protein
MTGKHDKPDEHERERDHAASQHGAKHDPGHKLTDAEIERLAGVAIDTWESGLDARATDAAGGLWAFAVVRDARTRLTAELTLPPKKQADGEDGEPAVVRHTEVDAAVLGTENARAVLASRILAVTQPA